MTRRLLSLVFLVVLMSPTRTASNADGTDCKLLNAFGSNNFLNTAFIFGLYSTQDLLITSLSVSFMSTEEGGVSTWNGTAHERFGSVSFKPEPVKSSPAWLETFTPVDLDRSTPREHTNGLPTLRFSAPVLLRANQASSLMIHSGDAQRGVRRAARRPAAPPRLANYPLPIPQWAEPPTTRSQPPPCHRSPAPRLPNPAGTSRRLTTKESCRTTGGLLQTAPC